MTNYRAAAVHCKSYKNPELSKAIARQFELLGPIETFVKPGDRVLIKPNMIAPKPRQYPVQTHPCVIIETARLLKDAGAKVIVGDSPAWGTVFSCARALGLTEPLKHLGIPLRALNRPVYQKIGQSQTRVGISSVLQEVDTIINIPKFKMHSQMAGTFAVKNMFGCVCGKWKPYFHFTKGSSQEQFSRFLIDLYKAIAPKLTIIDAVVAMQGSGPINGSPRNLGWIISSTDPIACERICAKLINMPAEYFPIIKTAKTMQYGCTNDNAIKILGDIPDFSIQQNFTPAKPSPIRFSLIRIIKSITKGLFISLLNHMPRNTATAHFDKKQNQ